MYFYNFFRNFVIRMTGRLNRRKHLDNENITEILMDSDSEREFEDESLSVYKLGPELLCRQVWTRAGV